MQVVASVNRKKSPPLISLSIFGAPHRRMHVAVIQQYRIELRRALHAVDLMTPINHPVDLWLLFIDPTSPDYDNLLMALFQAMDGATLKKPGILTDDSLVETIRYIGKIYTS